MKFKINILLLIMILLSAAGCQKDEIIVFDVNDSGVMFPGAGDAKTYKGYNSADQIYYVNESFLNVPLSQVKYIVDFPVRVSGDTVSRDRVIGYEVVAQMTDALNTQYKIVDAIIPAGEYYGRIRFELT
ncbi:MAG TPA: hypothetical protein DDX10_05355, partial [Rikenellaceae bacterium]|nr:hypothetical protein [Rikenellaceae bacterium]